MKCHFVECSSCPSHVKEETKAYMQQKEASKVENLMNSRMDFDVGGDNDCVEVEGGSTKVFARKKQRQKGPLDRFFTLNPEDVIKGRKMEPEGNNKP